MVARVCRAMPGLHKNVYRRWPLFPRVLRETFVKAFSREAITTPTVRIMDRAWQQILIQVRSQYTCCPHCGEKTFITPGGDSRCVRCGCVISRPMVLAVGNYRIPLVAGQEIYTCEALATLNTDLYALAGRVERSPDGRKIGIRNVCSVPWHVTSPQRQVRSIAPGSAFAIADGMMISFSNHSAAGTITY